MLLDPEMRRLGHQQRIPGGEPKTPANIGDHGHIIPRTFGRRVAVHRPARHSADVEPGALALRPIGVFHTPFRDRVSAPRQPRAAEGVSGAIELFAGHGYEDALADLDRWQYIWVIFWFHRNEGWKAKVLPPRSNKRRGLFATRTPHRPNPIGLSVLRLERVEGLVVHVRDVDVLDGTPVLDLKPYVAWTDAIADARGGWLEDEQALDATTTTSVGRPPDPRSSWEVTFGARARDQMVFLREAALDLEPSVVAVLSLGPQPHAYRRIRLEADGTGRLAVKEWRVRFRVEGRRIEVLDVGTGYRESQLRGDQPEHAVHRAFVARFGGA